MMLVAVTGSRSEAAEWSAEPSLSVRGDYNSNLILTSAAHEGTFGHWVSPGVKFSGSTENLEVSGKAAADFIRYYGGIEKGLTNLYFPVAVKYGLDRETLAFDGGFTRDNTLMGELLSTGVVLSFTQRNLWNLAPSWTHAFTERFSAQGTYTYSKATYENGARLGLVDYDLHAGSGALSYQLNERDRVQLIGNYTTFSVAATDALRSHIAGAQLSYSHAFDESLTATLTGGPQLVSSSINVPGGRLTDSQTIWIASGSLRKQWEDSSAELTASREILPSGFGLLIQTERLGVTYSKDLTERVSASLTAQVYWVSAVTSKATPFSFPENRFIYVSPRVSWKITQWLSADLAYARYDRTVDNPSEHAASNAATLMFTYYPPKLTVGR